LSVLPQVKIWGDGARWEISSRPSVGVPREIFPCTSPTPDFDLR
jgi:hypothetical protein